MRAVFLAAVLGALLCSGALSAPVGAALRPLAMWSTAHPATSFMGAAGLVDAKATARRANPVFRAAWEAPSGPVVLLPPDPRPWRADSAAALTAPATPIALRMGRAPPSA
ncbi:MAG: hypothetical protein JSU00_15675 [Acidobacteria bacterium]|nr:hypothetical protein [Acidobacteriota bacterium]